MFLMFPRDHKGVSLQASPESRTRKYKRVLRRSLVRFLAASLAGNKGFFAVSQCLVGKMILAIIRVIFFRTRWLLLDMTEPNYGWLLLTLISRLEIRKKESGRPQAVDLSFLRATRRGRRESAKVKFCKFLQAGRSARLSNRAMFKIILILIPW